MLNFLMIISRVFYDMTVKLKFSQPSDRVESQDESSTPGQVRAREAAIKRCIEEEIRKQIMSDLQRSRSGQQQPPQQSPTHSEGILDI